MQKRKAYFNWSSGKDSALALHRALCSGRYDVELLFSLVREGDGKVAMHEVGEDLMMQQAKSIGIPIKLLKIDPSWDTVQYAAVMEREMAQLRQDGFEVALFGDIYLGELRAKREEKCRQSGFSADFPLWGSQPEDLMREFFDLGFKAVITCIDRSKLPADVLGRTLDGDLVAGFPAEVDVCGENGEYHSFAYDGPLFDVPVGFRKTRTYSCEYPGDEGAHRFDYLELQSQAGPVSVMG